MPRNFEDEDDDHLERESRLLRPSAKRKKSKETVTALEVIMGALTGTGVITGEVAIHRDKDTSKITLPPNMTWDEAITWLQRQKEAEETVVIITKDFPVFPLDGARAFMLALKEIYGWTTATGQGWWESAPTFHQIDVDYKKTENVVWGTITVPGIEGELSMSTTTKDKQLFFQFAAKVKQKHVAEIEKLATKVGEYCDRHSIYRGKALRLEFETQQSFFGTQKATKPIFMEPTDLEKEDLILPLVAEKEIHAGIFTVIEHYESLRKLGIQTKRANLLVGRPGVGKTMTATIASKLCVVHGRTFIYVADVRKLVEAVAFARQYAPAMIFAEDIDRVMSGPRTPAIDEILNTIDGVDTKRADILFVLTSNTPETITEAFLRTGRSDMITNIETPDEYAAVRLVTRYGNNNGNTMLDLTSDELSEVGVILAAAKMIPADIREVVERSKLFAVTEAAGDITNIRIRRDDLVFASSGVKAQIELTRKKGTVVLPPGYKSLGNLVLGPTDEPLSDKLHDMADGLQQAEDDD
jgi:ATPases of the AAA+ class